MSVFRIVLIEPEIPQNTGNIARLCAATDTELVLVGRLGFSIADKHLKRAGMDYWQHVKVTRVGTVEEYLATEPIFAAISTKGKKKYTEIHFKGNFDVVFGSESSGLPKYMYERYADSLYRIPMYGDLRSLNLSSSAAVVAYHLLASGGFSDLM